jgi:hypothetical protein
MNSLPAHKLHCLVFALFGLAWALAFSPNAEAAGAYPGACGTTCMAMGGGMFSPFVGTPFFPMASSPFVAQTGQMYYYGGYSMYPNMGINPQYVSNFLNWNGSQPLGLTMSPPLGSSAIFNDMLYTRMSAGMAR